MESTTTDVAQNNNTGISVRDEMVQTAIKFLQNPNVRTTPLAQKQKFLQRKGLTDQEIQIACEKSGAYDYHEQQKALPPPLPPVSTMKFIAPFLFGKKKKSVEESITELDENMKSSVEELRDNLRSVKIEVDKINQSSDTNTNRQLVELKSEIGSVKGLLLGRKQFPSVANSPVVPPSIPAWQMCSVTSDNNDDQDGDTEERKEELLEVGSGSGSSEPEHGMKTSESSLEIIYSSRDCDSESCHSRKSNKEENDKE